MARSTSRARFTAEAARTPASWEHALNRAAGLPIITLDWHGGVARTVPDRGAIHTGLLTLWHEWQGLRPVRNEPEH